MVNLMQEAIDLAFNWAGQHGLKFNPTKTECCFFHRKQARNTPTFADLYMGGVKLNYSTKIKNLGLTLDRKLTFKDHIKEKCLKAKRLLNLAKHVIGKEWGLSPRR